MFEVYHKTCFDGIVIASSSVSTICLRNQNILFSVIRKNPQTATTYDDENFSLPNWSCGSQVGHSTASKLRVANYNRICVQNGMVIFHKEITEISAKKPK